MRKWTFASSIAACVVAAATCCSSRAIADQLRVPYALGANTGTKPIDLPIANSPILMSCIQNGDTNNIGISQVTLFRSTTGNFISWIGLDAPNIFNYTGPIYGGSSARGQYMAACDVKRKVVIYVASATQIFIFNSSTVPASGVIMFVY